MNKIAIKGHVAPGSNLFEAISDAIDLAKKLDTPILINFNGYQMCLKASDDAQHECAGYRRWEAAGGLFQGKPKIIPLGGDSVQKG